LKGRITVPKKRLAGAGGGVCLQGGIKNGIKMEKRRTLKQLENDLQELKQSNKRSWDMWGSELCVESLLAGERKLEKEISERKAKALKRKNKEL
jgi:hypothetical protein